MTTSVNSVDNESDGARTSRMFVGFLNSIVGPDQNYVGQDGQPFQPAGQFSIANPDGSMSSMGVARSNQQGAVGSAAPGGINVMVIMAAGLAAYLYFNRGKK